ncbi:MAG: biopolymer transporter ExbD [Bacteriovoracales bacterium]
MSGRKSARLRRGKRGGESSGGTIELDITSLLDATVIILIFLVQTFNSSGVISSLHSGIVPPFSDSKVINHPGVNVEVSSDQIWVEDKLVVDDKTKMKTDHDGRRISSLFDELDQKRQTVQLVEKSSPEAKKFTGAINLIVDKSIKYSHLKQILFTCAEAGYKTYQLVVRGASN